MKLSPKAARFVIDALTHYHQLHEQKLRETDLSEDEASDLANDLQFLEAIKKDFEKYQNELAEQHSVASHA